MGSRKSIVRATCKTEGQAGMDEAVRKLRLKLDGPAKCPPGSLGEFIEETFWPMKAGREFNTRKAYKQHFANFSSLHRYRLEDLRLMVVQEWVNGFAVDHEPKTVRNNFGTLSTILTMARRLGKISHEEWKLVELPDLPETERPTLTPEQGELLLAAAKGTTMEGPIWAIFRCGLRPGEICGLKVPHISFEGDMAIVTVKDNRQSHGETGRLKGKKRGHVKRLAMPVEMGGKLLSFAKPGQLYVFVTKLGKPISNGRFSKEMVALCQAAKVPVVRFYDLRHSCATNMIEAGVESDTVQKIFDHSTKKMTKRYIQQRDALIAQALAKSGDTG